MIRILLFIATLLTLIGCKHADQSSSTSNTEKGDRYPSDIYGWYESKQYGTMMFTQTPIANSQKLNIHAVYIYKGGTIRGIYDPATGILAGNWYQAYSAKNSPAGGISFNFHKGETSKATGFDGDWWYKGRSFAKKPWEGNRYNLVRRASIEKAFRDIGFKEDTSRFRISILDHYPLFLELFEKDGGLLIDAIREAYAVARAKGYRAGIMINYANVFKINPVNKKFSLGISAVQLKSRKDLVKMKELVLRLSELAHNLLSINPYKKNLYYFGHFDLKKFNSNDKKLRISYLQKLQSIAIKNGHRSMGFDHKDYVDNDKFRDPTFNMANTNAMEIFLRTGKTSHMPVN